MKIRSDFVSNSSSSSFIVKDIRKAITLISELGDIPYEIDGSLNFTISYYHKDGKEISEKVMNQEYKKDIFDKNYWRYETQPDEIEYGWEIDFYRLKELIDKNDPILDKIISLSIESRESDSMTTSILYMLYEYFKRIGLNPDDSYSEVNFRNDTISNFVINLVNKFSEINGDKEGCQKH